MERIECHLRRGLTQRLRGNDARHLTRCHPGLHVFDHDLFREPVEGRLREPQGDEIAGIEVIAEECTPETVFGARTLLNSGDRIENMRTTDGSA